MQSGVKEITKNAVIFDRKGKTEQVEADLVLIATGRAANTETLHLENAGVEYNKMGITVNDDMMTNVEDIYAIGDVNARCMLAHAATFQGIHAVNHILGKADDIQLDVMPAAVFTTPEAAGVGLTEDFCKDNAADVAIFCVPKYAVASIADRLYKLGIRNFWNFSHYDLSVRYDDIIVENVHLNDSLMILCYKISDAHDEPENDQRNNKS